MKILSLALILIAFPMQINETCIPDQLIVWNVGQGQWLTFVNSEYCLHFDMGGEKAPILEIQKLCLTKKNILYLSHWDMDHVSFIRKFSQRVFQFCAAGKPLSPTSPWKKKLADSLKECPNSPQNLVQKIFSGSRGSQNSASRVFYLKPARVIVPGDSTSAEEKLWRPLAPAETRGLILGHHGSKTSTSDLLLQKADHLLWGISSARKARFGHPHAEVVRRLERRGISLLKTEDWGNIRILIK